MATFTSTYHRALYPAIDPEAVQNSQAGRTVLITGGTAGIGRAAAHAFLKANATCVIVVGRREEVLQSAVAALEKTKSSESRVIGRRCDIMSESDIDALWGHLGEEGAAVDTLVLNAAVLSALTDKPGLEAIWAKFQMNVLPNLRFADRFLAQGAAQGKVLINVSTGAAHNNPQRVNDGYGPSKLGISKVFEAMADQTPRECVQIHNIHPGIVRTDAAIAAGLSDSWMFDDAELSASFFVWAATRQATFLHGRFLWANWDVEELVSMKARFEEDPGLLRLGLNGVENMSPKVFMQWLKKRDGEVDNAR